MATKTRELRGEKNQDKVTTQTVMKLKKRLISSVSKKRELTRVCIELILKLEKRHKARPVIKKGQAKEE
jgi:hypothetical protein